MINLDVFKEAKARIHSRLDMEKKLLEREGIPVYRNSEDETIDHLIKKVEDTTFKILVLGSYASGKTSLINTLLGEVLFPVGILPTTALNTEICYGGKKKVIVYPRIGKWKGGDTPFEIKPTVSEIKEYSALNYDIGNNQRDGGKIESCFEKMVIYWPIDMLKGGVSIIDSPATNNPYSDNCIMGTYIPGADAILYCISSVQPYAKTDKMMLEQINNMGFNNPLIVSTFFDTITDSMEESELQEYTDTVQTLYLRHTTSECIHYVDSRLGLSAKQNHSKVDLIESGYYGLEWFLGNYLTENSGKEKLSGLTSMVSFYNNNQMKVLSGIEERKAALNEVFECLKETNLEMERIRKEFNII